MRKNSFWIFLVLLFALIFAAEGLCVMPEGDEPGSPPSKKQITRVRERIESIRMWKLTQALDLDEKTAASLFPIMSKYDKKRTEAERNIRESIKALKENLRDRNEHKLNDILERLEQYHRELQNIKDEEWTELKRILSTEQQAKFILFLQDFQREMREMIAQAKERKAERMKRN
ncbi:MAG: hypothetical protein AB1632_13160 [Nitrospirota bacterium]